VLDRSAGLHPLVHFLGEYPKRAAPLVLGPIEREIRFLQQSGEVPAVVRCAHDPDAGADQNLVALDRERLVEQRDQRPGEINDIAVVVGLGLDDGEFIAAEPRHQLMVFSRNPGGPPRDLLQQQIADPVAEGVVDALEVVEVHVVDREPPARIGACREGFGGALAERRTVRQPGQRGFAEREVVDTGLRILVLDRDGAQVHAGCDDLAVEGRSGRGWWCDSRMRRCR